MKLGEGSTMKCLYRWIAYSLFLLAVTACGGGSSGSGDSVTQPPPVADQDPGGIWFGTVFNATLGQSWEIIGITLSSGESRYVDALGSQYTATITVDGSAFSGSSFAVAPLGGTFIDGSVTTTGSMSGTLVERSRVSATYSLDTGETGTFELFYDSTYERSSSLAKMSGSWNDVNGNTFTVEADGSIFGQDGFGCVYTGNVGIIDPRYNVYRLTINVANCADINGTYTGLGTIGDWVVPNDDRLFIFQVSNDSWALTSTLEKDSVSVVEPTNVLYVAGQGPLGGVDTVSVDPQTGAVRDGLASNLPCCGFSDIEYVDGILYGVEDYGSSLFEIDIARGTRVRVGGTGAICVDCDLISHDGRLYQVDITGDVYEISLSSGLASPLNRRLPVGAVYAFDDNGMLWGIGGRWIYRVDFSTGAIVEERFVGSIPYLIDGVTFTSEGLIGIDRLGGALLLIDLASGQITPFAVVEAGLAFHKGITSQ
jgi:hypothetical protein